MNATIKEYEIINLFNEFKADYEVKNLTSEVSDMISVDPTRIEELTRWFDDKKVELSTVDAESELEVYFAFQQHIKQLYTEKQMSYENYIEVRSWAYQQWSDKRDEIDRSFSNTFDSINYNNDYEIFNDYRPAAKVLNYLVYFVERMSCKALQKAKYRIFELRNKNQMSYDIYIDCMLLVLEQIEEKYFTTQDHKLFAKFTKMKEQLSMISGDGRTDVADMHINIEDAIDMRRDAERLSARNFNRISQEEAFDMLMAQREGIFDDQLWLTEISNY